MLSAKYVNAYLKEYEKTAADSRNCVYRNADDYLADCLHTHERYCEGKAEEEQIRTWLNLLRDPETLGYKTAFVSGDMEALNNALYQTAVITHAKETSDTGTDHCHNAWAALKILAAGLTERFPLLLPAECGMSDNGHPVSVAMANLMMALWYRRADFADDARKKAEKTLSTKHPSADRAMLCYLIALLNGDAAEAGTQLDLYCQSVPRVQEFGVTKLDKMFWPSAHGLYNLAFFTQDRKMALQIPLPEPDCFCDELARWQIEHDFRPGKLFLEYPAPLGLVNRILAVTPPEYTLYQPYLDTDKRYRKQFFMDVEHFEARLAARVMNDGDRAERV
jgi:hypothetical protein